MRIFFVIFGRNNLIMNTLFTSLLHITLIYSNVALCQDKEDSDHGCKEVVQIPQEIAQFPGGQQEFSKFISKNMIYPKEAIDNGESGKVYVKFIVEKNGKLQDVRIARGVSPSIDAECIRLMNKSPYWTPAKNNGDPVCSEMMVPVNFALSDK